MNSLEDNLYRILNQIAGLSNDLMNEIVDAIVEDGSLTMLNK